MNGDRLESLRQRAAELESALAALDGRPQARKVVRQALAEIQTMAAALEEGASLLENSRRAFELERRRAREAERDPFQSAFTHAPIGMALLTMTGRPFKVNQAMCAMVGYGEEEVLAGKVEDVATPAEIAAAIAQGVRLLSGKVRSYQIEKRFRHRDGHLVETELSVSLVQGKDEQLPYYICQFVDITESKQTENALHESELRFENAFRHAPVGMVLATPDGRPLQLNQAFCRYLGYEEDELLAKTVYDVTHPEDLPRGETEMRRLLAGEIASFSCEKRYFHKQGHVVWALLNVSLMRDPAGMPRYIISQIIDIDERRKAEHALRESEERFRTLVENAFDAVFVLGADGKLLYASPSTSRMFGYDRPDVLGDYIQPYIHPEDLASVEGFLIDVASTGGALAIGEIRIRHREGHWVWIEGIAQNLLSNPHVRALIVNARDISERRQAEDALRGREARFRALMQHSSDVVSLVNGEGDMLYVGPSIDHVLGYSGDDLIGRNGFEFLHPDDRERTRVLLNEIAAVPGAMVTIPFRFQHKDGSWRWMESIFTNLLEEPSVAAIIVSSRDITDRREAELLLRESEERFALAVAGANEGLWDWDLATDEFYASPRFKEILGYADQADVSRPEVLGLSIHSDDLERVTSEFMGHVHGEKPNYEAEYRHAHMDGTYHWVRARGVCVADHAGKPYRIVGSLSDITARKQAEDEARQRQAELAHVLRVSAMGEMAAGLAHEINQPLAAIVNFARGCIHRLQTQEPPQEVIDALRRIADEALRAGGIVRGLRQFIRKEPPRHAAADLNLVVADAVNLVEADARLNGVAVRIAFADDIPPVNVDRVQIEQVIVNLVRNGLEAMDRGNGERRELAVRTMLGEGGTITVTVRDTGDGLPAGIVEEVFNPFFTTKANGLGMGLSISRSIIHAHGGRIWCDANPEGGTTFSFTIPLNGPPD